METRRVRRRVKAAVLAIVFIVFVGATYQGVATAIERREQPRPGALVNVGSHQLHIHCTGSGRPTVVLEAPAFGMSAAWDPVQARVATRTRVCSYDRSGLGWSEWGDRAYDAHRVPDDLHAALSALREPLPIVLVGEGLGAAFARLYAGRYPEDVAALVLVDSSPQSGAPALRAAAWLPWVSRVGLLRVLQLIGVNPFDVPDLPSGPMRMFLDRPDHLTRAVQELASASSVEARAEMTDVHAHVTERVETGSTSGFLIQTADVEMAAHAIVDAVTAARPR